MSRSRVVCYILFFVVGACQRSGAKPTTPKTGLGDKQTKYVVYETQLSARFVCKIQDGRYYRFDQPLLHVGSEASMSAHPPNLKTPGVVILRPEQDIFEAAASHYSVRYRSGRVMYSGESTHNENAVGRKQACQKARARARKHAFSLCRDALSHICANFSRQS